MTSPPGKACLSCLYKLLVFSCFLWHVSTLQLWVRYIRALWEKTRLIINCDSLQEVKCLRKEVKSECYSVCYVDIIPVNSLNCEALSAFLLLWQGLATRKWVQRSQSAKKTLEDHKAVCPEWRICSGLGICSEYEICLLLSMNLFRQFYLLFRVKCLFLKHL